MCVCIRCGRTTVRGEREIRHNEERERETERERERERESERERERERESECVVHPPRYY